MKSRNLAAAAGLLVTVALSHAAPAAPAAEPSATLVTGSNQASYLLGNQRLHGDPKILWEGFINGLRGLEHLGEPIGDSLYHETPLNNTSIRFLYLHHRFGEDSQLAGGELDVIAAQVRIALTERLGFIATKDGYSWLSAEGLPEGEGWNDITAGLKYAWYVDRANDFVVTSGLRVMLDNGDDDVLQSGNTELSPFISLAKGFGPLNLHANLTDRIPVDHDDGNNVLQWDLGVNMEVAPSILPGFNPTVELHGLHYLSDGERFPLSVGGADYTNLGSTDVAGSTVISLGGGFQWRLTPHLTVAALYEHALTNQNADIFRDRVTVSATLTW